MRAIVFDFDGVIALSEPVHVRAWEDLAREFDRPLPEGFLESGIGFSDVGLSEILCRAWGDPIPVAEMLGRKRALYARRSHETTLVPGVRDAIAHFAERVPLAIATSSSASDIDPVVERHGLRDYFRAILTIDHVRDPKPHPEIYLKAADRLGVEPERCWVFEDSAHGADAARAAGARVIGVTTTLAPERIGPVHGHVPDFSDLAGLRRLLFGDAFSE